MSTFHNYDPLKVTVSFDGVDIQGFADGAFVEVEREVDTWSKHVGATGDITRVRSRDRSGKIKIILMAASSSNDQMMALFLADELSGTGTGSFMLKDLSGNMRCNAKDCWIKKPPKVERGKDAGNVEWELECGDLTIVAGGNVNDTAP